MKATITAIAAIAMLMTGMAATEAVAGPENKCKACHSFDQGGKNKFGPNLFGIVGSKAGSNTDFGKYSKSLENGDWVWNEDNLKAWVCDSKQAIIDLTGDANAKTKMANQKQCGDDAEAVVSFLKTLK
ncbi:MAG TPA: c-type cytochrome [Mariprofundaceae bacterium]|nr:c-type cytochrome [Mariprofundaceae bacterium]